MERLPWRLLPPEYTSIILLFKKNSKGVQNYFDHKKLNTNILPKYECLPESN